VAAAESAFPRAVHRKQSKVCWPVGVRESMATKPCRSMDPDLAQRMGLRAYFGEGWLGMGYMAEAS
jgi:hypothetical protein